MADLTVAVTSEPIREAGQRVAAAVRQHLEAHGRARLAAPGGSALDALGEARRLLTPGEWSRVWLTWTDERCVPEADPDSTRGEALRRGTLATDHPPGLELPLVEDGETPGQAVERVRRGLEHDFGGALDVVLLGMGPDGHVASLFPGRAELASDELALHVADSPKPPPDRVTLTRRALATATTTVLLATGEAKRPALERLRRGDPSLPATGLPGLVLVTDVHL